MLYQALMMTRSASVTAVREQLGKFEAALAAPPERDREQGGAPAGRGERLELAAAGAVDVPEVLEYNPERDTGPRSSRCSFPGEP